MQKKSETLGNWPNMEKTEKMKSAPGGRRPMCKKQKTDPSCPRRAATKSLKHRE